MRGRRISASPIAPLVAFATATNLGIAGRTARLDGPVPGAARLRAVLTGFGARIVRTGPADVVFAADVDATAPTSTSSAPAVIVGCGPQQPSKAREVRPGVQATRAPEVFVVRGLPSAAAAARDAADDHDADAQRAAAAADDAADAAAHRDADARIDWARAHMPVSRALAAELGGRVRGLRIGISMVLEPKTAVLALLLQEAGAEVGVFAFAAETDGAVAAALAARGIAVHAAATASPAEERGHALALLDSCPQVLVDDGAHVIRLAHRERPGVVDGLIGATEETTSGVLPLRAMAAAGALRVPVIAANDAETKTWFDNRHGTGETCVLAIARALDDDLDGAEAAVVGFGPVGEGCAERLRALGAAVTVVDRDPRRALAARFAGYATAPIGTAVSAADLIVSATGVPGTIDATVLAACREDAVIAVAGGAPEEVLLPPGIRVEPAGPHLQRLVLQVEDGGDGPAAQGPDTAHGSPRDPAGTRPGGGAAAGAGPAAVRLLAGGDCVNIVAGEGNPIDVMDLSFAVQLAAIRRLLEGPALPAGVHALSAAADARVAGAAIGAPPSGWSGPAEPRWERTRFDLP